MKVRMAVAAALAILAEPAAAADKAATEKPPAPEIAKSYDPDLLRLAEILGTLTYLRGLCGDRDAETWQGRMQALLDAEGTTQMRKDRLAGAFNDGMQGYALSYRTCTPNARVIIDRFLADASRIAKAVENRFGAT